MAWIYVALASAALSGLTGILDKTVMYRYVISPLTLPLLIGISQSLVGGIILITIGTPEVTPVNAIVAAIGSGLLFGVSGLFLLRGLYSEEVSRVVPINQSAPIFAALLAMPLLGERINGIQWLGIGLTVLGTASLSFKSTHGWRQLRPDIRSIGLILSAIFYGCGMVIAKFAVDELPVDYTYGLRAVSLGGIFLLASYRSESISEMMNLFKTRSPALGFVFLNEFIVATGGLWLGLWALSLGPASLVVAVLGTRAFFVIIYSTTLGYFRRGALGESVNSSLVTIKILSGLAIVGGMFALTI